MAKVNLYEPPPPTERGWGLFATGEPHRNSFISSSSSSTLISAACTTLPSPQHMRVCVCACALACAPARACSPETLARSPGRPPSSGPPCPASPSPSAPSCWACHSCRSWRHRSPRWPPTCTHLCLSVRGRERKGKEFRVQSSEKFSPARGGGRKEGGLRNQQLQ